MINESEKLIKHELLSQGNQLKVLNPLLDLSVSYSRGTVGGFHVRYKSDSMRAGDAMGEPNSIYWWWNGMK